VPKLNSQSKERRTPGASARDLFNEKDKKSLFVQQDMA